MAYVLQGCYVTITISLDVNVVLCNRGENTFEMVASCSNFLVTTSHKDLAKLKFLACMFQESKTIEMSRQWKVTVTTPADRYNFITFCWKCNLMHKSHYCLLELTLWDVVKISFMQEVRLTIELSPFYSQAFIRNPWSSFHNICLAYSILNREFLDTWGRGFPKGPLRCPLTKSSSDTSDVMARRTSKNNDSWK